MYKDILVAVDINDESSSKKAVAVAVECSRAFGARLHLLNVVPDFGMSIVSQYFPKDYAEKALEEAKKKLEGYSAKHVPSDMKVQHVVAHGTIYEEILSTARKLDADLIVMASHRPELKDYLLGPNAARVVRHSNRSVLVVRD